MTAGARFAWRPGARDPRTELASPKKGDVPRGRGSRLPAGAAWPSRLDAARGAQPSRVVYLSVRCRTGAITRCCAVATATAARRGGPGGSVPGGWLIEVVGDGKPAAGVESPVWIYATRPHPVLERLGRPASTSGRRRLARSCAAPRRRWRSSRRGSRVRGRGRAEGRRAGPVRRINAAVAGAARAGRGGAAQALGFSMMLAGVIVWLVARGPVLLGYDEAFIGLDTAQLNAANARLVPFMEHDRDARRRDDRARRAYAGLAMDGLTALGVGRGGLSAAIGFVSFLLFVGYGYFDPLHFGLTAGLLPTFFLTVKDRASRALPPPDLQQRRRLEARADGPVAAGERGAGGHRRRAGSSPRSASAAVRPVRPGLPAGVEGRDRGDRPAADQLDRARPRGLRRGRARGRRRGPGDRRRKRHPPRHARRLWWTLAAAVLASAATTIVHLEVGCLTFAVSRACSARGRASTRAR